MAATGLATMEVSRLVNTSASEPAEASTSATSPSSSVTGKSMLPTTAHTAAMKVESR